RFCKPDSRPFQSLSLMTPYLDIDEAFTEVVVRRTLQDEFDFLSSFFSVLSLLISKLPLDLRCLHVHADDVAPMDWVELFGRCNKVTTLNVMGRHGFELLELMADVENDASSGGNHMASEDDGGGTHGGDASNISPSVRTMGRPLFPQLRRLLAHELNFKKPTPLAPSTPIQHLETILEQRRQRGFPVEKLRIKRCTFKSRQNLDCLKKLVPDFSWDGAKRREWDSSMSPPCAEDVIRISRA
ncbi:hypothetical protein BC834DRAFT_909939, partial [Gloeopeniophorella convolvens]